MDNLKTIEIGDELLIAPKGKLRALYTYDKETKQYKNLYENQTIRITHHYGNSYFEYTLKDGFLHSFNDEPAEIVMYSDGNSTKTWYTDGIVDRKIGPAIIYYVPNFIDKEYYYINGECFENFDDFIKFVEISDDKKIEMVLKYS